MGTLCNELDSLLWQSISCSVISFTPGQSQLPLQGRREAGMEQGQGGTEGQGQACEEQSKNTILYQLSSCKGI